MKKILVVLVALALLAPAAAWAGDNTDPRVSQVEDAIRAVYPDKKVDIYTEPYGYGLHFTCLGQKKDGMTFTILSNGSLRDRTLENEDFKKLERLEIKIKKIFNPNDQRGAK